MSAPDDQVQTSCRASEQGKAADVHAASRDGMKGLAEMLEALPEQVVRYRLPELTILYCNASWAAWYDSEPASVDRSQAQTSSCRPTGTPAWPRSLRVSAHTTRSLADEIIREAPNAPGQVGGVGRPIPAHRRWRRGGPCCRARRDGTSHRRGEAGGEREQVPRSCRQVRRRDVALRPAAVSRTSTT